MKSNRFLKKGYTTGSCAAAAAKAAVMTVLNDEIVITTQITLPKGESISIDITTRRLTVTVSLAQLKSTAVTILT